MSNQKVDEDVRGAVGRAMNWDVRWDVRGAVGKAMNWAVDRAVGDAVVVAVHRAVHGDPEHPALQDFMHSAALV